MDRVRRMILARLKGLQGVTADEPLYKAVHTDRAQIILLRDWAGR